MHSVVLQSINRSSGSIEKRVDLGMVDFNTNHIPNSPASKYLSALINILNKNADLIGSNLKFQVVIKPIAYHTEASFLTLSKKLAEERLVELNDTIAKANVNTKRTNKLNHVNADKGIIQAKKMVDYHNPFSNTNHSIDGVRYILN